MTHISKVEIVTALLKEEGVESEYCSPNFVADFAWNRGFRLTSAEVVQISNDYMLEEVE